MSDETIKDALKITLEDYRLSRGEKRALAKVIEKFARDEHQLALARQQAFKLAREQLIGPDALAVVDWLEQVICGHYRMLQFSLSDIADMAPLLEREPKCFVHAGAGSIAV